MGWGTFAWSLIYCFPWETLFGFINFSGRLFLFYCSVFLFNVNNTKFLNFFFLESGFTVTYLWQHSATCCKVIFGSFSNLFSIMRLISVCFVENSQCKNNKYLKLSALRSVSLKSFVYYLCKSSKIFSFLSSQIKTFPSFEKKRSLRTEVFNK